MNQSVETRFRCPGETYWIDRPTHLARLAAGYAGCRSCADRFETGGLLLGRARAGDDACDTIAPDPAELPLASATAAQFCGGEAIWAAEGLAGTAVNQIDVPVARRLAMAVGTVLAQLPDAGSPVRVAVGGDGRWLSAPLVAAVSQGCQRAGGRVIETGNATAGSLAMIIRQQGLDGGILIGNALSATQTVSLKCWGPEARPWSAGGGLEPVRRALADEAVRTSRRFGGLERVDLTNEYHQQLGELFHGLRPLRFVLDATSRPLVDHLRLLVGHSACEIISPGVPDGQPDGAGLRTGTTRKGPETARSKRLDRLRAQVARVKADFGLWIDGDGDCLVLVDQRSRQIGPERLLWALWRKASDRAARQAIVLASDCAPTGRQLFESAGARVIETESTREAVDAAMRESGAVAAAGPGDRLWFAGQSPTCDALVSVGWILQMLSGQDRPISEMLD